MFTSTELLKQYVKEAFARENIPASDERIQSWSDYRRELARNKLGVLGTSSGRGLVLSENLASLQDEAIDRQIAWYSDFNRWQASCFWSELNAQAEVISADPERTTAALGSRLVSVLSSASGEVDASTFLAFNDLNSEIMRLMTRLRTDVDDRLRRAFVQELKRDNRLLDDFLAFVNSLDERTDGAEEFDDLDAQDQEEDEARPRGSSREEVFESYKQAARAQARAALSGRRLGHRLRNSKIVDWLGSRSLPESQQLDVGRRLPVLSALRYFSSPLRRYIGQMPVRYRGFRRERQAQGTWYLPDGYASNELSPLEVDAILLAMLSAASELLKDQHVLQNLGGSGFTILRKIRDLYRTQIVVDEATDFSPLQLGCMAALCDPSTRSFLACGDFNQRVSDWGTRSLDELRSMLPDVDVRSIKVTYRHSRQLNELTHRLIRLADPSVSKAYLPQHVRNEGVHPVLAKGVTGQAVAEWLAARITEIERFTRSVPSIAVLVHREEEVRPLAGFLSAALSKQNIRALGCPAGQVVGQDNDVRVFDVQHIKGLEFEAVFFVGIDELAVRYPTLFEKYFYVGATRAATYLGVTCVSNELPARIKPLEDAFAATWR
jgi:UvrD-like helicase C-terminal domain